MRIRRSLITLVGALAPVLHGASLEDVLSRMDRSAKAFRSYSATGTWLEYTKVIGDGYERNVSMRLKRSKNGAAGIIDLTAGPDHTIWRLDGPSAEEYLPKANTVRLYDLRKYSAAIERFVLLGFSVTGDQLKKDYVLTLGGTAVVNSTSTTRIVLTPKSADSLGIVKTIELWIPDGKGNPTQQKFNEPSGDYKLVTFSDLSVNPTLPDSAFELVTPAGVNRIKAN